MRRLFLVGPLLLLAGFSPPDLLPLPPQGVQEAPPRSWIPDKAEKPPITVTPDLPNKSTPETSGTATTPSEQRTLSIITPSECKARAQGGGKPSEAFVHAYNAAKAAIVAKEYETALARVLEAESVATSFSMQSATLWMKALVLAELGDSARLEEAIARRTALGCLTGNELKVFESAREMIEQRAAPQ